MARKNTLMWDERWKMTQFLYEKGWMLTVKELGDVIEDYGFEEEYVKWRKNHSTSHNTDYDSESNDSTLQGDIKQSFMSHNQ